MLPKDIVRAAIRQEGPPRLPVRFPCFQCNDIAGLPVKAGEGFAPRVEGADEWGCVWEHTAVKNMGQVKGHPLANAADLDSLPVPDYSDDSRYIDAPAALDPVFVLAVDGENQLLGGIHDLDLDPAGIGHHERARTQRMRTNDVDTKTADAGMKNGAAG